MYSSGSSRASNSPLLQHNQTPVSPSRNVSGGSTVANTAAIQPQPYLYPTASEYKSGEPVFGEVKHGDTKFMGKPRYVSHKNVSESKDGGEEEQKSRTLGEGWLEYYVVLVVTVRVVC